MMKKALFILFILCLIPAIADARTSEVYGNLSVSGDATVWGNLTVEGEFYAETLYGDGANLTGVTASETDTIATVLARGSFASSNMSLDGNVSVNDLIIATPALIYALSHDSFSDFVANEHIDWTQDQGATNINAGNYTDTNTQLSDIDINDFGYIKNVSETDQVFVASQANNITEQMITDLGNLSGVNTGDQDLTSYLTIDGAAAIYLPIAINNDSADDLSDNNSTELLDTANIAYTNGVEVFDSNLSIGNNLSVKGNIHIEGIYYGNGSGLTLASTDLSDTADLLYEAELDSFSELQSQISDKTLINEEDATEFDNDVTVSGVLFSDIRVLSISSNLSVSAGQAYGSIIYCNAPVTIELPAVQSGMSIVVITVGTAAVSVDPNASDRIWLDGVALDDGDKITNKSTAGDVAVITYFDATGWYAVTGSKTSSYVWTDGG